MGRRLTTVALALLVLAGATAAVLLLSSGSSKRDQRVSDYAFDSRYQVREAESRLDERVLSEEMTSDRLGGGGEVRLRTTRCVVDPPPPAAQRMICSVTTAVKEVRSKVTVIRYYWRRASVVINRSTGALKLGIAAPRRGRAIVTP
jgi:hypothetical protein